MTRRWPVLLWWLGLAGHLVALVWYAASGLVAPPWAVVGLLVIWAVLLVVGLRLRTRGRRGCSSSRWSTWRCGSV
jgi:hypothetical protein